MPPKKRPPASRDIESEYYEAYIRALESEISQHDLESLKLEMEIGEKVREIKASEENQRVYYFTEEVTGREVTWAIKEIGGWATYSDDPITVVFNSPGGSVTDGLALYDFLRRVSLKGTPITTVGLGEVASMGGVLLQAGDKRIVAPHTAMLIHEISAFSFGKTSEMEDYLDLYRKAQDQILTILAGRSRLTKPEIAKRWKRKDWWLFANEIRELGFADEVSLDF